MSNLVKRANEGGYRARADRPIQSGRVVSVNTTNGTAILDIGHTDANGTAVYMIDVPFSPQTPPQVNDTVSLLRTNSNPYSLVIGGAQVGGANTGQIVKAGGAVTSVRKNGETAGQQGDVTLSAGANITITRTGKTFSIAALAADGTASPTSRGQILYCEDGANWTAATPLAGDDGHLITEDETGYLVVSG